jgi:hypothetical protein
MERLDTLPFDQDSLGSNQIHPLPNSTCVSHRPLRPARPQPVQVVGTCGRRARCEVTEFKNFPLGINEKCLAPTASAEPSKASRGSGAIAPHYKTRTEHARIDHPRDPGLCPAVPWCAKSPNWRNLPDTFQRGRHTSNESFSKWLFDLAQCSGATVRGVSAPMVPNLGDKPLGPTRLKVHQQTSLSSNWPICENLLEMDRSDHNALSAPRSGLWPLRPELQYGRRSYPHCHQSGAGYSSARATDILQEPSWRATPL